MLGLNTDERCVSGRMLTTADTLFGYEVTEVIGLVEGIAEGAFNILAIGHVALEKGGGLDSLLETAKLNMRRTAGLRGADAIISVRYEVLGRHTEKGVLAYGTAVRCKKAV